MRAAAWLGRRLLGRGTGGALPPGPVGRRQAPDGLRVALPATVMVRGPARGGF